MAQVEHIIVENAPRKVLNKLRLIGIEKAKRLQEGKETRKQSGERIQMNKIRFLNMCIVEFGKKFGLPTRLSYIYLKEHSALSFLDSCYEGEHLLPLQQTLSDLKLYCKRHGGTIE